MAVTIGFGGTDTTPYFENGFMIDDARIVNGNCADAPCMGLNDNEISNLTKVGGGAFTLDSFWFKLVGNGNPNQLTVKSYSGATLITTVQLAVPTYTFNTGYVYSIAFPNITSISFDTIGGGNARIDDINVSAVPLPSALPLFASGLGVLGWLGWRKKRKAATTA